MTIKHATFLTAFAFTALSLAGCSNLGSMMSGGDSLKLSAAQEVPPVTSSATGSGAIMVAADKSVSGSITTTGIEGNAAHIHMAAMGKNGPVIVPLTKTGDATWTVPTGTKLTDAQYGSYLAGDTYVNVHSSANPAGEIRGQLKPK